MEGDLELCRDAVGAFNVDPQIEMVTEEAGELVIELGKLIVALQKWKRKPSPETVRKIATEHADVELMLKQLKYIFDEYVGPEYSVELDHEREYKRTRLRERIADHMVENRKAEP